MKCMLYQNRKKRRKNITNEDVKVVEEAMRRLAYGKLYDTIRNVAPDSIEDGASYSNNWNINNN